MNRPRSSRHIIKMRVKTWHRRNRTAIDLPAGDRPAGATGDPQGAGAATHSAFTASGLAVADQVRKAWRSTPAGLAGF